jgi:hypothetical protein
VFGHGLIIKVERYEFLAMQALVLSVYVKTLQNPLLHGNLDCIDGGWQPESGITMGYCTDMELKEEFKSDIECPWQGQDPEKHLYMILSLWKGGCKEDYRWHTMIGNL